MPDPTSCLPPLRWIARMLRETTETLMHELAAPTELAPSWNDAQWRVAQAVAAIHGISPMLARTLHWEGPTYWRTFLQDQRAHTEARHARIETLVARIDESALRVGVPIVALKGVALHRENIYRAGERPMADVDLLVHSRNRASAVRLIESLGYRFSLETWKHTVYKPYEGRAQARLGEHSDNPIKIELHTRIFERLPIGEFDITDLVLTETAGLGIYARRSALFSHLLLHASGAIVSRFLRALHLEDLARVSRTLRTTDWHEIQALIRDRQYWWAFAPLALLERYFPNIVPASVLGEARDACGWLLRTSIVRRTLADVSLSAPYVQAFPGVEWSRTIDEVVRYVSERVRPTPEILELRKQFDKHQALGQDMSWVRQSQTTRMMRWLLSRPARVETIATVRAAFTGH